MASDEKLKTWALGKKTGLHEGLNFSLSWYFQHLYKQYVHRTAAGLSVFCAWCFSDYSLNVEVTLSLRCPVISSNKESAQMTWIQTGTPASAHFCKTTPWQSTLTFMKEFSWINEQMLCSLSEVFLIIWTLFSLHATPYQKCIKLFFFLSFCLSCVCTFIFPSACLHLPLQSSTEVIGDVQRDNQRNSWCSHTCSSLRSPDVHVGLQQRVDAVDDPAEEASVQGLGHGVSNIGGFVHGVGSNDGLAPRDHTLRGQSLLELLRADAEERCSWVRKKEKKEEDC